MPTTWSLVTSCLASEAICDGLVCSVSGKYLIGCPLIPPLAFTQAKYAAVMFSMSLKSVPGLLGVDRPDVDRRAGGRHARLGAAGGGRGGARGRRARRRRRRRGRRRWCVARARSWRPRGSCSRSLSYSRPGRRARPPRRRRPPSASVRGRVYSCALPSLNYQKKSFSSERTRFSAFQVMRSAQGGRQKKPPLTSPQVNGASLHCFALFALRFEMCHRSSCYRVVILELWIMVRAPEDG